MIIQIVVCVCLHRWASVGVSFCLSMTHVPMYCACTFMFEHMSALGIDKEKLWRDEIEVSKIRITAKNISQSTFCCIYSMPHIGNSLSGAKEIDQKYTCHSYNGP